MIFPFNIFIVESSTSSARDELQCDVRCGVLQIDHISALCHSQDDEKKETNKQLPFSNMQRSLPIDSAISSLLRFFVFFVILRGGGIVWSIFFFQCFFFFINSLKYFLSNQSVNNSIVLSKTFMFTVKHYYAINDQLMITWMMTTIDDAVNSI